MNRTNIAWTDFSWNPITGCSAISDGCKNCYAKQMHETRLKHTHGGIPFSEIIFHEDRLKEPLNKRKSYNIFVGSMTDLFHDDVSFEWLDEIFHIMMRTPHLTYQILTKRPRRMEEYLLSLRDDKWELAVYKSRLAMTEMSPLLSHTEIGGVRKWEKTQEWIARDFEKDAQDFIFNNFPNVIFGVTAENQKEADIRIPLLLNMPVSKRFVSVEPMIGEINLDMLIAPNMGNRFREVTSSLMGVKTFWDSKNLQAEEIINKLDWVIVGGESGAKSKVRELKPKWVQEIADDCEDSNTAFFFKQWGAFKPKEKYDFEDKKEKIL